MSDPEKRRLWWSVLAGLPVGPEMVDVSFDPIDLSVNESDCDIFLFIQYNGVQTCYLLLHHL